ncbi:hypothetical protein D3C76_1768580 [compost metagenome]
MVDRHSDDRAFEHGVVDRCGEEYQGRQASAGVTEQTSGEQGHRLARTDGVTTDDRVNQPIADHR